MFVDASKYNIYSNYDTKNQFWEKNVKGILNISTLCFNAMSGCSFTNFFKCFFYSNYVQN